MKYMGFLLMLISLQTLAVEVKITCSKLGGNASCTMNRENSSFMRINQNSVYFVTGRNCGHDRCDWLGIASPNILKIGSNRAYFGVSTATTDPNLYTYQKFDFFFSNFWKVDHISKRRGTDVDEDYKEIYLELNEIDPALYNQYLQMREQYLSADKDSVERELKEIEKERAEIDKRIQELQRELASIRGKNFDEIDAAILARLGIGESQLRLLTARREELLQFEQDSSYSFDRQQTNLRAKYEAIRARARVYNAELPDLPPKPDQRGRTEEKISDYVFEMHKELQSILNDFEKAQSSEDLELMRKSLRQWKRQSDFAISLYTETSELNQAEKSLLYQIINEGAHRIFSSGITQDLWTKKNDLQPSHRLALDNLALKEEVARDLRSTLNFKKIPEQIKPLVQETLNDIEKLSSRIDNFKPQNDHEKSALGIGQAALTHSMKTLNKGIAENSIDDVEEAQESVSLGLMVLDIGLDMLPIVGSAKSAVELFTGKNFVTGESLTAAEVSLSFVGIFLGIKGFNVSKINPNRAKRVCDGILSSLKINSNPLLYSGTVKSLPQMDTLIASYKLLKRPFLKVESSRTVNLFLNKKYQRFTDPAFTGSKVLSRVSEPGEKFCRVFSQVNGKGPKFHADGGIFVFRCADILLKSLDEIMEMASIHAKPKESVFHIVEIIPPAGINVFEGIASSLNGNKGGALQVFLDIDDRGLLTQLEAISKIIKSFE